MANQTLIIHKFKILFNILSEVKNLVNFRIRSVNTDKIDMPDKDSNFLIISGDKRIKLNNQIYIEEYPINLNKLLEIININFLKKKFSEQNKINIGNYIINLNSRYMLKGNNKISLTEKEAKIIIFLYNNKKPSSIVDLQKEVWGHKSKLETHTVETHIYRLRKKIEKKFNDKIFITSLKSGYKINA